ncbi:hypothetical protein Pcac1_g1232 [Phytophthora cactorum]|nr:hypothetical protein Pcac1_g1232 [Phytophthora cactorum]
MAVVFDFATYSATQCHAALAGPSCFACFFAAIASEHIIATTALEYGQTC